jgi:osmotically-inducible protein OsmY
MILWLLLPAALAVSACGGDDGEAELVAATQALEAARVDVDQASAAVDARRAEVEEARRELAAAEKELAEARRRLEEARAEVDADATDTLVFRSVQRRLLEEDDLEGVAISAQVKAGVVTLTGDVPDDEIRKRAVEVAEKTPGVARVQDRIRVLASAGEEQQGT